MLQNFRIDPIAETQNDGRYDDEPCGMTEPPPGERVGGREGE